MGQVDMLWREGVFDTVFLFGYSLSVDSRYFGLEGIRVELIWFQ
jgi:hypothetical protein